MIIVNVAVESLDNPGTPDSATNILELSAVKLNTCGFKIESIFQDYAKITAKKVLTRKKCKTTTPELLTVSDTPNDVLDGFQLWLNMESLENFPSDDSDSSDSEDKVSDALKLNVSPLDICKVHINSNIDNIFWPREPLKDFLIVTWGDWHFQEFLQNKDDIKYLPDYCHKWCNLKTIYMKTMNVLLSEVTFSCAFSKLGLSASEYDDQSGLGICVAVAQIMSKLELIGTQFYNTGQLLIG